MHDIGKNYVTVYVYDETTIRKDQNDVSLLLHHLNNDDFTTNTLVLLSDGCPAQNKKYLMINFLYFLAQRFCIFFLYKNIHDYQTIKTSVS